MSCGPTGNGRPTDRKGLHKVSVAAFRQEFQSATSGALHRSGQTAKVIALRIEKSPRTVENYKAEATKMPAPEFFVLAREIPELRAKALEWLDADMNYEADPTKALTELMTKMARLDPKVIAAAVAKLKDKPA